MQRASVTGLFGAGRLATKKDPGNIADGTAAIFVETLGEIYAYMVALSCSPENTRGALRSLRGLLWKEMRWELLGLLSCCLRGACSSSSDSSLRSDGAERPIWGIASKSTIVCRRQLAKLRHLGLQSHHARSCSRPGELRHWRHRPIEVCEVC